MSRSPVPALLAALLTAALGVAPVADVQAQQAQQAQQPQQSTEGGKKKEKKAKTLGTQVDTTPRPLPPLFLEDTPLEATLTTNIRQLKRDRGDKSPWRAATLAYAGPDGAPVRVPVRVRTRGIWRRKNCDMPPIRLNFTKDSVRKTAFAHLDKPKLVNVCRDDDRYEAWLLEEMNLYRVYNAITPMSSRVRLLRLSYVDSASGKQSMNRYAFVIEEPDAFARRHGGRIIAQQGARPDDVAADASATFGLFEYLIGNTDFSITGLHNVFLAAVDTQVVPVAYDFDFSGAVETRYSSPDPRLGIRSVRQRLYRGFCVPPDAFARGYALFRERKEAIYALYGERDPIGKLLQPNDRKDTIGYFDEFYRILDDRRDTKRYVEDACLGRG